MADKRKDAEVQELELFGMSVASAPQKPESETQQNARKQSVPTAEALQKDRDKAENQILLFTRGMFYRAYNSSAWMLSCLFRADFRVLRDRTADGTTYVYLGFPVSKLGEVFTEDCETENIGGCTVVNVKRERLREMPSFEQWLAKVKVKDRRETELPADADMPIGASVHITNAQDIALRLATYHMESHTMLENMQFLSSLIAAIKYK